MRAGALVGLVMMASGCGFLLGGGAGGPGGAGAQGPITRHTEIPIVEDDPGADPFDFGTPGNGNGYSHAAQVAVQCGCQAIEAERKLTIAAARLAGTPNDAPEVEGRAGCIEHQLIMDIPSAGPPELDLPKAFADAQGSEVTIDDYGNIAVAKGGIAQLASLPVSDALRTAMGAQQMCSAMALKIATSTNSLSIDPGNNHGLNDLPGYLGQERARLIRVIRASRRADVVAAGATGLAASFRRAVKTGQADDLVKTAEAVSKALPVGQGEASKADLDALMARGSDAAEKIHRDAAAWAQQYRAQSAGASAGAGKPMLRESGGEPSDEEAIANAFLGLMRGDVGAIIGGAAVLFPEDSPIRHGMKAGSSLLAGDVAGTLKSASKMVPPDNPMATALALAGEVADAKP